LLSIESLIDNWREHPETAVTTGLVAEGFGSAEDGSRQLDSPISLGRVDRFDLHATPELLDRGVVERVADGPKRMHQASGTYPAAEGPRGVLWTVVAVHQGPSGRPAGPDGHAERRVQHGHMRSTVRTDSSCFLQDNSVGAQELLLCLGCALHDYITAEKTAEAQRLERSKTPG